MRNTFIAVFIALFATAGIGQTPTITTVAGNGIEGYSGDGGPATLAEVSSSYMAVDRAGNIYLGEAWGTQWEGNHRIRRVNKATGTITTVVGGGYLPYPNDGELGTNIVIDGGGGSRVAVDSGGNLYFTENLSAGGLMIRRMDAATGIVTTVAGGGTSTNLVYIVIPGLGPGAEPDPNVPFQFASGDGVPATSAFLGHVTSMTIDAAGHIYFTDFNVVRRVDAVTGIITTVAGNGVLELFLRYRQRDGYLAFAIRGVHSGDGGPATSVGFNPLGGIALDTEGNMYVVEEGLYQPGPDPIPNFVEEGTSVRKINLATNTVTTVVGTHNQPGGYTGDGGPAIAATLSGSGWLPLACDAAGNLFISDWGNFAIRRVDAITGIITTIAGDGTYASGGDGGPASLAQLGPWDLAFDANGDLYVIDWTDTRSIRKVSGLSPNAMPTANAGADQAIHASGLVQLDGSTSFDDNTPSASLLYAWTLVTRPAGSSAALTGPFTANPTFVADLPGTYVAELVVTDAGNLASMLDEVVVSSTNLAPVANADADQGGVVSQLVQLNGLGSVDPELDPLTFFWGFIAMPAGSAATLSDVFTATTTFVPDLPGVYVVGLLVDDGFGPSAVDEVVITVITGQQFAENTTVVAINTTSTLPATSVTTGGNQQAMVSFLSQAVQGVQSGNLAEARLKLQMTIARCDGWALRGAADQNGPGRDWVTEEVAARDLYLQLTAALNALSP